MSIRGASGPRSSGQAIEKELGKWELTRSRHDQPPAAQTPPVQDFVCVSRMVGINDTVPVAVAEALGWPVFGKELLETMAGNDPVRRRLYEYMDQRDLTWWDETVLSLMGQGFTQNDYFRRLCETVLSLARKGHAVFVGRGVDQILPRDVGFRVGLTASRASREKMLAETLGTDPEQAERRLRETEPKRQEFLRNHFGVEAEDPLRHDLILNLDRWTTGEASELILHARAVAPRGADRVRGG